MSWDWIPPTPQAPNRETIARPLAVPSPFGPLGPSAGVGQDAPSGALSTSSATGGPATRALARELIKLPALDDERYHTPFEIGYRTLTWYNPLGAVIYVVWGYGGSPPSADPRNANEAEFALPGQSAGSYPIPTAATGLTAAVVYPGAVPGSDAGVEAVLSLVSEILPVFIGPLA